MLERYRRGFKINIKTSRENNSPFPKYHLSTWILLIDFGYYIPSFGDGIVKDTLGFELKIEGSVCLNMASSVSCSEWNWEKCSLGISLEQVWMVSIFPCKRIRLHPRMFLRYMHCLLIPLFFLFSPYLLPEADILEHTMSTLIYFLKWGAIRFTVKEWDIFKQNVEWKWSET